MPEQRRKFSPQFRAEAMQLVIETGKPVAEVVRDLCVVAQTLGSWVEAWRDANPEPEAKLSPLDRARVGELEEENRRLRMENEFVKNAQYTSIRYTSRLLEAGALASIGTVGASYDNALAETVVGLYKSECVRTDGSFRGVEDLELATASWVHWFNTNRLHSTLDYATPIEYENAYHVATGESAA